MPLATRELIAFRLQAILVFHGQDKVAQRHRPQHFGPLDKQREDIEVIGLAYEEIEPQAMRDFLKQRPVSYPVAILDVYSPPADFATPRGLPMTFLIAPDGKVARQFMGPVTAKEIEAAIADDLQRG